MTRRDSRRAQALRLATLIALGTGVFAALAAPSSADVTAVFGRATDYVSNVSLFGGPSVQRGPAGTPGCDPNQPVPGPGGTRTEACNISVELPPTGGNESASDPDAAFARYGPAIVFSRGPATVSTQGTTGPGGSVTSSAELQDINTSGQEVFTADALVSSCTASEIGITGSTTITNGTLITSEGNPDVEGDETVVTLPTNPDPNATFSGVIESVGDSFEYIFNEQVTNPDGSLTVYAAHLRLLGPTAVGDVFIGRVDCGVTATQTGTTTTTTGTDGTTTTIGPGTTTTTSGVTTTTRPPTTTTTGPGATTTTVVGVTTTQPAGGGGRPPGGSAGPLVRTGSAPESLMVLGALSLVLGALVLVGLRSRAAPADGQWAMLDRQLTAWRRERRPWRRRRWF